MMKQILMATNLSACRLTLWYPRLFLSLGLLLQQAKGAQTPLSSSEAAHFLAKGTGALSILDRAVLPAAGPLHCTTRAANGCQHEVAEEQVVTPDRLELPPGFQDGWGEICMWVLPSHSLNPCIPTLLPCTVVSDV